MDLKHYRVEYDHPPLIESEMDSDPIRQFEAWFKEAQAAHIPEPNAMSLATVNADGQPSARTVLLKYFDTGGFVFFTNHTSRKATDIAHNPRVALLFLWSELHRQVKIEGTAEKVRPIEAARYFASRPLGSKIGAWISDQSSTISSRTLLFEKFKQFKDNLTGKDVDMPSWWGGYRVIPHRIEFWQGGKHRIHDRIQYRLEEREGWLISRLQP